MTNDPLDGYPVAEFATQPPAQNTSTDVREFAKLVYEMRARQREFFDCGRDMSWDDRKRLLADSKRLERRVDEALPGYLSGQKTLF